MDTASSSLYILSFHSEPADIIRSSSNEYILILTPPLHPYHINTDHIYAKIIQKIITNKYKQSKHRDKNKSNNHAGR